MNKSIDFIKTLIKVNEENLIWSSSGNYKSKTLYPLGYQTV